MLCVSSYVITAFLLDQAVPVECELLAAALRVGSAVWLAELHTLLVFFGSIRSAQMPRQITCIPESIHLLL